MKHVNLFPSLWGRVSSRQLNKWYRAILFTISGLFATDFSQLSAQTSDDCPLVWDPGAQYYNLPSGFDPQSQTSYVKIYFHVFREDDGSGGLSTAQIDQAKTLLDNSFNPHGIYFIYDCLIDFIPNTYLYENGLEKVKVYPNDPSDSGPFYYPNTCSVSSINSHDDGLDIYILSSQNGVHGAAGLSGSIPSDWLVVGGSWESAGSPGVNVPNALSATLPHEVGHCLGLMHTTTGNVNNSKMYCPNALSSETYYDCSATAHTFSVCAELVNGSNCDGCGDRICDTSADWFEIKCNSPYPSYLQKDFPCYDPNCHPLNTNGHPEVVDPNCAKYAPDFSNLMGLSSNNSLCRTQFSIEQGYVMHNFLQTHPLLANVTRTAQEYAHSVDCNCNPQDVHLTSATTYTGDEIINGNLILHAGADVLVTGILRFPEGKGIEVKRGSRLKVEGGLLTVACEHHHWEGITVEGNGSLDQPNIQNMPTSNEAGVVLLTQGATIEKAGMAMYTIRKNASWDENYWGGVVYAQNAFFKDCYRAAAFMKYRPYVGHTNKSRFVDCDIRGTGDYWLNSTGITIWATDGIIFKKNAFEDIKKSGLLVYDAYTEVYDDNLFEGNQFGITGIASAPFMGSMIIGKSSTGIHRNVFRDNYVHVHASGMQHPGKGKYTVANNDFFNGLAGVWLDGTNSYNVRRNSFLNQTWSGLSYNTGFDFNKIECNTFQDNNLGIGFQGINSESQFLENSFINNTWTDVNLYGTSTNLGVIRDFQGTAGWPAENCFTVEKIPVVTSGNTSLFNYLIETSTPFVSCKRPICNLSDGCTNPNHYVVDFTDDEFGSRCGLPDPSIPTEPNFHQMDSLLVYWTDEYLADTTDMTAHINMVEYGSLRQDALFHQVGFYANMQQDSLLIDLLVQEGTPYAERLLYGYYLRSDRFTEASTLLMDMLQSTSVEDQQFATIQQINLAFYQSPATFTLDSIQTQLLWDAAESEFGDRAWARSMLTYHLDAAFYPEVVAEPRFAEGMATPQQINLWKVYPNPAQEVLLIELLEGVEKDHFRFQVMDLLGRVVIMQQGSGTQTTMQLDGLKAGTYILGIHSDGNTPEYHKFQIQK